MNGSVEAESSYKKFITITKQEQFIAVAGILSFYYRRTKHV
jgi:hypothetical protein